MNTSALEATVQTLQQELAEVEAQAAKLRTAIATVSGLLPVAPINRGDTSDVNGNGLRPKLREVLVDVVRSAFGANEFGVKALYPLMAARGFPSHNSVRQVVTQLATDGVLVAKPGATRWEPYKYRLTNKPLPRRGAK